MRSLTAVTLLLPVAVALPVLSPRKQETQPRSAAQGLLEGLPSPFVPNLGQWPHQGKFIHRAGPMTMFLENRGWVLNFVEPRSKERPDRFRSFPAVDIPQKVRGVALRMTFEGDTYLPEIVGEQKLPGHHNYFLGNDESRWRNGVPLYGSVRYGGLYPGIDVRLRQANGVPEYDLLLEAGANLSQVRVRVEGGQGLSIAKDGSLVIQTDLGPVTQPKPKTWTVDAIGRMREVACHFVLLGTDRFGFTAPGWDGGQSLTIDPGLIWSTFLGGSRDDVAFAVSVDARGMVTVAGETGSTGFPTNKGAYTTLSGTSDAFVSQLDPSKKGNAQLVYSTFLGGSGQERALALSVDGKGVVTVAGGGNSTNFPTKNAYSTTNGGMRDAFVSRLDPSKQGTAQLLYSTYLGGSKDDHFNTLSVNASGVMTMAGNTFSTNFPTKKAYDTTYNGTGTGVVGGDGFVSRLDPSKQGTAQLLYSTFLGGDNDDVANSLSVDAKGVVTVAGFTFAKLPVSIKFPTTAKAYSQTRGGGSADAFVSRLDPSKTGNAQLVYSTFLGGNSDEVILGLSVDARTGIATVTGWTGSSNFPTTAGAYNTIWAGGNAIPGGDAFVSRLIPANLGKGAGLVYSTFLGGSKDEGGSSLSVDASGVVTVTGPTTSTDFPTTPGAHDTSYNGGKVVPGGDVFVSRLDPNKPANKQLIYSTFLGGSGDEASFALSVDASGVATVAGFTDSKGFPWTKSAYDTSYNGGVTPLPQRPAPRGDVFVSRLDMGVALYGDVHEVSLSAGGTQKLTVNAGPVHKGRSYWIFGSVTGTTPGVTLGSAIGPVHIPLNPDLWTNITIAQPNSPTLKNTKGTVNGSGNALASFNIPQINLPSAIGVVFHHAFLIYDQKNNYYLASNAVPLKLVR